MNTGNGNFFDGGIIYNLNYLKSWRLKSEKIIDPDPRGFSCILCMTRQSLFNFLKTDYNQIFEKWSKILIKNNCEATDIDIGNGIEKDELDPDFLYPVDRFYFSVKFGGKYCGKIKIALYLDNGDEGAKSLVISYSIEISAKLCNDDEYRIVLLSARKIFYQIVAVVGVVFSDFIKTNRLHKFLQEEQGGYTLASLTANSAKIDGNMIEKLSKGEIGDITPEIQKHYKNSYVFLDTLTTRNRRFKKYNCVLEKTSGTNGRATTIYEFKGNKNYGVFIGMSDNPVLFNENLKFQVITNSLKLS